MLTVFTILSTLIMLALGLMWRSTDPLNLTIKFFLCGMFVWGVILIAIQGAF